MYTLHKENTKPEAEAYIKELLDDYDVTVNKSQLKRIDSSVLIVSCNRRHWCCLLDANAGKKKLSG